ncbi:MAG: DNA repair protein RecO [Patescibacteria group bacterium]
MVKTQAVVLRRRDLKERDKLLTLYTQEHGKLTVRAIGAKKIESKLGGHVEPFMRTEVCLVTSKTIDILAGAQVVEAYPQLRSSISGTHAAQYLMEVVDQLTPDGQQEPSVYELLCSGLDILNQQSRVNFLTVQATVLKILGRLGFEPELDKCVHCALPTVSGDYLFNVSAGGVTHSRCGGDITWAAPQVQFETIKSLRFSLRSPLDAMASLRLSPIIWEQLNTCIDQLVLTHSRKPIRSRLFLAQAN